MEDWTGEVCLGEVDRLGGHRRPERDEPAEQELENGPPMDGRDEKE
jgi:hypothetical protein